jgi:glycosyltransferase involved in cell wall biosynthesis
MNIAHIQGIFSPEHGGPAQSLTNYCRGQVAAGHRVSVWTLEGFPHTSAAIRLESPIEMHVCRVNQPVRLGCSTEMCRQLRAADVPDVYHLHGAWLRAMHYGAVEAVRRKRPYVVELMGMYEPWALGQKWLQKRLARWWFQDRILRGAACLHVNSNQEAGYLRELGFKTPVAVIPVGADVEKIERLKAETLKLEPGPVRLENKKEFQPGSASASGASFGAPPKDSAATPSPISSSQVVSVSEFQLSAFNNASISQLPSPLGLDGRPFVLFLSRLHPKKGLDLLIRCWAKNRKSDDWMLVIAGTGTPDYVNQCRELAEQLGIANQCLWLGHVDELQKSWLFTYAHCYALPTSSENFGNTVAEALAHGTPVITTRHTPWTDLPKHRCGWLVDNTETELCGALDEAMRLSVATRQAMGGNGIALVRGKYSLELVCKNILAVYEWVLGGGPKPDCVQTKS